jgi:hypothetical protein
MFGLTSDVPRLRFGFGVDEALGFGDGAGAKELGWCFYYCIGSRQLVYSEQT